MAIRALHIDTGRRSREEEEQGGGAGRRMDREEEEEQGGEEQEGWNRRGGAGRRRSRKEEEQGGGAGTHLALGRTTALNTWSPSNWGSKNLTLKRGQTAGEAPPTGCDVDHSLKQEVDPERLLPYGAVGHDVTQRWDWRLYGPGGRG